MEFGPILIWRGADSDNVSLAAVVSLRSENAPLGFSVGDVPVDPKRLAEIDGHVIWRFDFALPVGQVAEYAYGEQTFPVDTRYDGDLNIGFVSCNGQENGDLERDPDERNLMWNDLAARADATPYHLMLHGGDQVYADEVTNAHKLTRHWPDDLSDDFTETELEDLFQSLRAAYLHRYGQVYSAAPFARVMARTPSLMMWDDHDICDGWGSLKPEIVDHPIAQTLFRAAREAFLLFQHAATDADVPQLFLDQTGRSLAWRYDLPGVSIIAPDLRSERTRDRIMGENGWAAMEKAVLDVQERVILVSSVPLLGPRLSVLEWIFNTFHIVKKYHDDLRDQWQSRAHRAEWQRMLQTVLNLEDQGATVTAVSGEIHLATRAVMDSPKGGVQQLVASGISHPAPPKLYALSLGTFARLGEAPLAGHPIKIAPLPGQHHNYSAERNYLNFRRMDGLWEAQWALEDSGNTPWLTL